MLGSMIVRGVFLGLLACASLSPATLIRSAHVVDGTGADPRVADVLIEGERIAAVGEGLSVPPGAEIIDARGQTLLPGLIDLHTHLPYSAVSRTSGDWGKNLKAYLYCGVTSVVDFGVYPEQFAPMRRLIAEGLPAPRIHYAARIATPGGHGMEGGRGHYFTRAVMTPEAARTVVAELAEYEPDAIKVFTDGWRYGAAASMTDISLETLAAIVEEAHARDIEVLTHTVTLRGAKIASAAGVDVLAHGIGDAPADAELVALLRDKGTTYAPTLAVYHPRGANIFTPLLDAVLSPTLEARIRPTLQEPDGELPLVRRYDEETPRAKRWRNLSYNTSALNGAGIRFGLGTDAGVTRAYHGWSTVRELELLVHTGLTPLEALTAGTGQSAAALNVDGERGFIRPGHLADLVLIDGKPFEDIADMHNVKRVFLGGEEIDRAALKTAIAADRVTPVPSRALPALLDDMQGWPRRSDIDTTWVNRTESGLDVTRMLLTTTMRAPGDQALMITAWMGALGRPFASADLPLTPGAIEPADASAFAGIQFDVRGNGFYEIVLANRSVRDYAYARAEFGANPTWGQAKISFSDFQHPDGTPLKRVDDLIRVQFEIRRDRGQTAWLELDNIRLY